MHRFFIKRDNMFNDRIVIEGDDVQHISRVLRLGENDEVMLCDGEGTDYRAVLREIGKSNIKADIVETIPSSGEAEVKTVLYQGIPKSTKMDLIIQKCTEMGIARIVPITTVRTIVKLDTEKDERKKVERWTKIAEEAAKQSSRGIIPSIAMPMTLSEALEDAKKLDLAVIPYELERENTVKLALNSQKPQSIGYFVGPEGGFDISEIEKAKSAGVIPITLGPRILRTETAGFALLTCIMYEYDQMS